QGPSASRAPRAEDEHRGDHGRPVTFEPTEWRIRSTPLRPRAVLAEGDSARALIQNLEKRSDEDLARLRGVRAVPGLPLALLLVGESEDLPWADGVIYLGRDEAAPSPRAGSARRASPRGRRRARRVRRPLPPRQL